jgi:hypothetical protein
MGKFSDYAVNDCQAGTEFLLRDAHLQIKKPENSGFFMG